MELEHIHPFIDGNGRMGNLWQTRLLMLYHPVFEFLPVEHLIRENRQEYYRALAKSDDSGDCPGPASRRQEGFAETLRRQTHIAVSVQTDKG